VFTRKINIHTKKTASGWNVALPCSDVAVKFTVYYSNGDDSDSEKTPYFSCIILVGKLTYLNENFTFSHNIDE